MRTILLILSTLLTVIPCQSSTREEVAIEASWGTLRGTLWLPETATSTAILLIAGSGPTDRYGNSPAGIQTNCYALLAEALQEAGYATLSYDKRGIAASYYLHSEELLTDCHFTHYVEDAWSWVKVLYQRGFERVVIAGHSEGSTIALAVAESHPEVSAVISLCGAAWPIDQILKMQLGAQLLPSHYALYASACRILDQLKQGEAPTEVPSTLATLFPAYLNTFYYEQMQYDPQQLLRRLTCPVLLVGGGHDSQITAENTRTLKGCAPKAQWIIVEQMCHVLKDAEAGPVSSQLVSYTTPSLPLSAPLVPALLDFLATLESR